MRQGLPELAGISPKQSLRSTIVLHLNGDNDGIVHL